MKFDTDDRNVNGLQRGYALAQCTRDINNSSCRSCLGKLTDNIQSCCQGKKGWRISTPNCYLRYEEYLFYQQPPPPSPPHPPPPPPLVPVAPQPTPIDEGKGGNNTTKIVIITLSTFVAVATAALLGFWYYSSSCRKKEQKGEGITEEILLPNFRGSEHPEFDAGIHATDEEHTGEMLCFSLATIQAATNNFSNANKLGEGGFGPVYKDDPADRPTMSLVVLMLGSQAINLPQPSTPPYSVGRFITTFSDLSSTSTTGTGTGFLASDTQTSSTILSK
ncbi:hypothetical protein QYF36_006635 [Acer negundo]|nr:hypothetical protein QYF36_006635 [Acer negundo]